MAECNIKITGELSLNKLNLKVIVCLMLFSQSLFADSTNETDILIPSDGHAYDNFGNSVAIDGERIAVGSYLDDDPYNRSGSVYIFKQNGVEWNEEAKLTASDGGGWLGYSTAIASNRVLVGAPRADGFAGFDGAAYMYYYNGSSWIEEQKFIGNYPGPNQSYGYSVSISGDWAMVGAPSDHEFGGEAGAVYVYHRTGSGWVEAAKLKGHDTVGSSLFGGDVSLSGDWAAITGRVSGENAVYLFRRENMIWTEHTKLIGTDPDSQYFGGSVSLSNDRLLITATHLDFTQSVYVYHYSASQWSEEVELLPSNIQAQDGYGAATAIAGDWAVVSAPQAENDTGQLAGSIHVFQRFGNSWVERAKLFASDGESYDYMGSSVSIFGNIVVAGAPDSDVVGQWSGSAYVFDLTDLEDAPNTRIISGPSGTVNSPVLIFTYAGEDNYDPATALVYSYQADGQPWSGYQSSTTATIEGLIEGEHIFRVRARDTDGNVDPSPAERKFSYEVWDSGGDWNGIATGPGPGMYNPPLVRTQEGQWLAYGVNRYGVNVSSGNLDGQGQDEVITGPGPGAVFGPHVRAFRVNGTAFPGVSFIAYGTNKYGVIVSAGDIDGDGYDEIITGAGPGAVFGPHVRGWNCDGGPAEAISGISYFAYGTLKWGVNVACGDIDGDGYDEIITGAGPGAVFGAHVRGWNYDNSGTVHPIPQVSYFAYGTPRYGVNVATGDLNGDGIDEIITGSGPGSMFGAHTRGWKFDSNQITSLPGVNFFAYQGYMFGVAVSAGDIDGDGIDEILTMPGPDENAPAYLRAWNVDGGTAALIPSVDFYAYDDWMTHGGKVAGGQFD